MSIDRDRLIEQSQGLEHRLFCHCRKGRQRTQIEIVGGEVSRRPSSRAAHLGRLQRRLDDAGNAEGDPILQFEDIFQRAVEAISPQMRTGERIDQLPGDAHLRARLAHRAFKDIADPQIAPDLFHVDGAALVGEGRIAGDDEEPADA
jgi:hypothetical protein